MTPAYFADDDEGTQSLCFEWDPTVAGDEPRPTDADPETYHRQPLLNTIQVNQL